MSATRTVSPISPQSFHHSRADAAHTHRDNARPLHSIPFHECPGSIRPGRLIPWRRNRVMQFLVPKIIDDRSRRQVPWCAADVRFWMRPCPAHVGEAANRCSASSAGKQPPVQELVGSRVDVDRRSRPSDNRGAQDQKGGVYKTASNTDRRKLGAYSVNKSMSCCVFPSRSSSQVEFLGRVGS